MTLMLSQLIGFTFCESTGQVRLTAKAVGARREFLLSNLALMSTSYPYPNSGVDDLEDRNVRSKRRPCEQGRIEKSASTSKRRVCFLKNAHDSHSDYWISHNHIVKTSF